MKTIILIIHNVRSAHNVGSMLRTAEGLGVSRVYLTGYTSYPKKDKKDARLPHMAAKVDARIRKTALGAEKYISWEHNENTQKVIENLKNKGFEVCALEQNPNSIRLDNFKPSDKIALIVGNEVDGLDEPVLQAASKVLEIPMQGQKESFNAAQAAAMALFHIRFAQKNA